MDKYGYINTRGEFVVEPLFFKAGPHNGDYARADLAYKDASHPTLTGCSVSKTGKVTPIKNLTVFSSFSEGISHFSKDSMSCIRGLVDADGNELTPCIYQNANNMFQGRAIVSVLKPNADKGKHSSYEYVLIDNQGKELRKIGLTGTTVTDWANGLAVCRPDSQQDDRYCYVDRDGAIVVRSPGGVSYDFADGLASYTEVKNGNYHHGFFDLTGKVVIAPQYDSAHMFSEGLAAVQVGRSWHYINKDNERVISLPKDCSRARDFHQGLAAVQLGGEEKPDEFGRLKVKGGLWGFIDRTGKVVITPKFGEAWSRECFTDDGLASVCQTIDGEPRYGFIDREGSYVIKPTFTKAYQFSSGLAAVQVGSSTFSPEDWRDWDQTEDHPSRAGDLKKFFKDYPVIGMTRSEIHSLLGKGETFQPQGETEQQNRMHSPLGGVATAVLRSNYCMKTNVWLVGEDHAWTISLRSIGSEILSFSSNTSKSSHSCSKNASVNEYTTQYCD